MVLFEGHWDNVTDQIPLFLMPSRKLRALFLAHQSKHIERVVERCFQNVSHFWLRFVSSPLFFFYFSH